jgi:ketosteroid isomerase-like protein
MFLLVTRDWRLATLDSTEIKMTVNPAIVAAIALVLACDRPPGSVGSASRDTGSSASQQIPETSAAPVAPMAPAGPAGPVDLDAPRSAFSHAFTATDTTAFDSLFVPDGAVIDMAGMDAEPLEGSSGVRVFARRVLSDRASAGPRFTPDTVQLDDGRARESGRWSWARGAQKNQGTYSIAWRQSADGRWRVAEYRFLQR